MALAEISLSLKIAVNFLYFGNQGLPFSFGRELPHKFLTLRQNSGIVSLLPSIIREKLEKI